MIVARSFHRLAPWWTPWGAALRLAHAYRSPADVYWSLRIGWFVIRLSGNVERTHLTDFLGGLRSAARPSAIDSRAGAQRIARLRQPWLRLPGLRGRDTCYVRALSMYRFLDAGAHDMQLRIGAEWFDRPGGALRGHAWVTLDRDVLEGPPGVDDHDRLMPIHWNQTRNDRVG